MIVEEEQKPEPWIDRNQINLQGDFLSVEQNENISDEDYLLLGKASDLESIGKHKKAGNIYDKLCKKNRPNSYVWYAAGRNAMNLGKLKDAIKDFEKAQQGADCPSGIHENIEQLLADTRNYRAAQIQERQEFWGSLIVATLVAGTQQYVAHETAKLNDSAIKSNAKTSTTSRGGSVSSSSSFSRSSSSSSSSSPSHECAYCNGTGKILHERDVSTGGMGYQSKGNCPECGANLSNQTSHKHVRCGHCGGTGQRR